MPRLVDESERRATIGAAVWELVREAGVSAASVRNIADRTGLAVGSIRHYFPSQASVHTYAMQLVTERIEQRVSELDLSADPFESACQTLAQLLPLDDERREENSVWLAFTAAAMTDPHLFRVRERAYDHLRSASERAVLGIIGPQATPSVLRLETERVFALIDGLAVHAAVCPSQAPPELLSEVLRHHLESLRDLQR